MTNFYIVIRYFFKKIVADRKYSQMPSRNHHPLPPPPQHHPTLRPALKPFHTIPRTSSSYWHHCCDTWRKPFLEYPVRDKNNYEHFPIMVRTNTWFDRGDMQSHAITFIYSNGCNQHPSPLYLVTFGHMNTLDITSKWPMVSNATPTNLSSRAFLHNRRS